MTGEIRVRRDRDASLDVVSDLNPFPVEVVKGPGEGKLRQWRIPISVSTTAYTANDAVGQLIKLDGAARGPIGCGAIVSVTVIDLSDQGAALALAIFDNIFTPTADNSAMAVSDADAVKCIGQLPILTTDYTDFGGFKIATVMNQWLGYQCVDGNLYAQLLTTGTPTYAVGELYLRVTALMD